MGGGGTHIRFLFGARTRSPYIGRIDRFFHSVRMDIQRNVLLKKFTTFRIGGTADFFVRVKSSDELKEALVYAKTNRLKIFILGGGSNIVFSDDGFKGLVIKIEIKGVVSRSATESSVTLAVGAGEEFDDFVSFCVVNSLYGIENLSAIPGTVGAAPIQNIGAYGMEVKDTIEWVDAVHIKTCETKRFTCTECNFAYRDSFFKTKTGKEYCITRVCFNVKKKARLNLSYADLVTYFGKNNASSLQEVRDAIIDIRSQKFPDLNKVGTAGSFFKNPILTVKEFQALQEKFQEKFQKKRIEIPRYKTKEGLIKVPLGFILEKLGWKGKEYTSLSTYRNQALVIVNNACATQKQLETFACMIEKDVKEKINIVIEKEVTFVE